MSGGALPRSALAFVSRRSGMSSERAIPTRSLTMKNFNTSLICACIALAAGSVSAQDATKNDTMPKDGMMKKDMTMQECKDHMAMMKKDGMKKDAPKKDDAMMKQEARCMDMMKKGEMPSEPMKK
jgi:hypothetical protein